METKWSGTAWLTSLAYLIETAGALQVEILKVKYKAIMEFSEGWGYEG